jgi:hypothetical protein
MTEGKRKEIILLFYAKILTTDNSDIGLVPNIFRAFRVFHSDLNALFKFISSKPE